MVDESDPLENFESWLLHRVAQAVEAGDVPGHLFTELRGRIQVAREKPAEVGMADAVRTIAEIAGVSRERAGELLASLETQPTVRREAFLRRVTEVWLEGQRQRSQSRPGA